MHGNVLLGSGLDSHYVTNWACPTAGHLSWSSGSEFQSEGRLLVGHLAVNISALKLGKQTQISSVKRLYHLFPPERRQFEGEYFVQAVMFFVFVLLCWKATGLHAFVASTTTSNLMVKENSGADLKCDYSADFGASPRVEWKFRNLKGSQSFIYFDGQITDRYKGQVTQYQGGLRIEKATRQDTGDYSCEVSGNSGYAEATIKLTVLVPPSVPNSQIPTSATTGRNILLTCIDKDGSPPSTYKWYKNGTPLPEDPSKFPMFKNLTYKMNMQNGNLEFPSASKADSGSYYCEASNGQGTQRGPAVAMEVRDLNVGGIVAGVIVALLAAALLCFALWYASRKGYLPKMSESKPKPAVYTQPEQDYGHEDDGEFRQKQSFVV